MSGIYIKGMEMPTSCGDCKAFVCYRQWAGDIGDCFCGITKNDAKAKEKNADCPLVPVPPHGRLIDADALVNKHFGKEFLSRIMTADEDDLGTALVNVPLVINNAPTIIPAEEDE